jgi:hypothetical protein
MPKFLQARDIDLFKSIARELVDDVVQNTIVLYKINMNETQFIGGSPDNNFSIVCETFMVSKSVLNIEERAK